jgi:hypothetical protein
MQKNILYLLIFAASYGCASEDGALDRAGAAGGGGAVRRMEQTYQYSTHPEGKGDNHYGVIGASWSDSAFRETIKDYCNALRSLEDTLDPRALQVREAFELKCVEYKKKRALEFYRYDFDDISRNSSWDFMLDTEFGDVQKNNIKSFEAEIVKKDIDDTALKQAQDVFMNVIKRNLYDIMLNDSRDKFMKYSGCSDYDFYLEMFFYYIDFFRRGVNLLENEGRIDHDSYKEYESGLDIFFYRRKRKPQNCRLEEEALELLEALPIKAGSEYDRSREYYREYFKELKAVISIQKVVRGYLVRKKLQSE